MKLIRYWLNRLLLGSEWSRVPSWRVVYADGASVPLTRGDAMARLKVFNGLRVEYCRDYKGDLLP